MVFRASKAKPSQLDRCLTASPPDVFVLSNAQISSFRPLVRPIFLHNFLTKYPYNPIVVPWVPACLARHHSNLQSGFMMLDARALSVLSCANRLRRWPLGLRNTDLTDAHGFIITDRLFFLMALGPVDFRRIFRILRSCDSLLIPVKPKSSYICTVQYY